MITEALREQLLYFYVSDFSYATCAILRFEAY